MAVYGPALAANALTGAFNSFFKGQAQGEEAAMQERLGETKRQFLEAETAKMKQPRTATVGSTIVQEQPEGGGWSPVFTAPETPGAAAQRGYYGQLTDWQRMRTEALQRDERERAEWQAGGRDRLVEELHTRFGIKPNEYMLRGIFYAPTRQAALEHLKVLDPALIRAEAAESKLSPAQQRIQDYLASKNLPNTPTNRIEAERGLKLADPSFQESQARRKVAESTLDLATGRAQTQQYEKFVQPMLKKIGALNDLTILDQAAGNMNRKGLLPPPNANVIDVRLKELFTREWANPTDPDFVAFRGLYNPIMIGEIDRSLYDEKGLRAIQIFIDQYNLSQRIPSYEAFSGFLKTLRRSIIDKAKKDAEAARQLPALQPAVQGLLGGMLRDPNLTEDDDDYQVVR